jgi:hypothetical protein
MDAYGEIAGLVSNLKLSTFPQNICPNLTEVVVLFLFLAMQMHRFLGTTTCCWAYLGSFHRLLSLRCAWNALGSIFSFL